MRADKFLYHRKNLGRKGAHAAIAERKLIVEGQIVHLNSEQIDRFDRVVFDGEVLQDERPVYIALHKPKGYVCATRDKENSTVMELIQDVEEELHIVGRLDKNTTGLVLLTNDGKWSRRISEPGSKLPKVYLVESENVIDEKMVTAFREGILFEKEKVTSHPAVVAVLAETRMRLTIFEGLHHQVKRMFLKFGNRVKSLHRDEVAGVSLKVSEGEWRYLSDEEKLFTEAIC